MHWFSILYDPTGYKQIHLITLQEKNLTPINPALLKVKWIFTLGGTIKITHFPCEWLRHPSLTRAENLLSGNNKKSGTEKAHLSSFVNHSTRHLYSYFPPWHQADSHHPPDTRVRKCQLSTRSFSHFYRKSVYTGWQKGSLTGSAAHSM